MRCTQLIFARTLATALLVVAGCGSAVHAATTILQFNRWLSPSHFIQTELLEPWAADVEKATEGRVRIEMTASSLGPPARQFDLVRSGVAQMTWSATGYTANRFLTGKSVEMPFKTTTAEALSVAYWRVHNKYFAPANEYAGVKLLSLHTHVPGEIYTTKASLTTPEDLKGLKIRIPNPATSDLLKAYGGVGVAAPSSKAYELLSNGVIDGTFLTPDAVTQFNLTDMIKHQLAVDGGFFNAGFYLIMNQAAWGKISEADQKAIKDLSGEAFSRRAGRVWDAEAAKSQKILQEKGVAKMVLDEPHTNALKEKLGNIETAWIQAVAAKKVDGRAALDSLHEEVARYQSN